MQTQNEDFKNDKYVPMSTVELIMKYKIAIRHYDEKVIAEMEDGFKNLVYVYDYETPEAALDRLVRCIVLSHMSRNGLKDLQEAIKDIGETIH